VSEGRDFAAEGRAILDANLYMVLGTADRAGRPWVTPVYYAHSGYRELFWVSKPEARHSRSLDARDTVGIVIFDSTVPINSGRAVYMSAAARKLDGDGAAAALAVYSRRAVSHGGREVSPRDVEPPARLRLYAATVLDAYVLDENDERVPVVL
jgi:nitroimidazol reductase NimA-like FMN-containing flavoprotein (pyridoxamine 5'-phosphate oxidase superfamily)